jgi:hypothetical protein
VKTAIYRFFDVDGRLLYVGITGDVPARWGWHQRHSVWWPEHVRSEVSWCADRAEADVLETAAIRTENPVHNIAKRRIPPPTRVDRTVDQAPILAKLRASAERARELEKEAWEAILIARQAGVPDVMLCEKTQISRSTLNRKFGPRSTVRATTDYPRDQPRNRV